MKPPQTTPAAEEACPFVLGEEAISVWPETHAQAWVGLLETHKRLTRALNAELEARHGLSLSGLELLGRLAGTEGHLLRVTALAEQASLSVSRASRIIDALAERGLVTRSACTEDGRARNVSLTDAGLALAGLAQGTHREGVQRDFFDHLEPGELETLAAVFARLAPTGAGSCLETAAPAPA